MSEQLAGFTPERRRVLLVWGCILTALGLLLPVLGFIGFMASGLAWVQSLGDSGMPFGWLLLPLLGMPLLVVGVVLLYLGLTRRITEAVAAETAGAVEHASAAWGRGAGRGLAESGLPVGGQVVKVKCRSCGFLESEDARFCSRCSKPV